MMEAELLTGKGGQLRRVSKVPQKKTVSVAHFSTCNQRSTMEDLKVDPALLFVPESLTALVSRSAFETCIISSEIFVTRCIFLNLFVVIVAK